ncbi:calcitonin/calcitonin-related polypeptide, alpha isoform X3 [Silurus meridionalis]|uniref:calcitonin/calcitonin-related polypeptide, alpha isoform X3 n=1 Tax=Silurus meridionalis TaxID=175797 RepID=UPI001EEC2C8D|nr:calcitonin/calcitonin-related polypeptide, alpha isoform X3 [Silurus meridionalis]
MPGQHLSNDLNWSRYCEHLESVLWFTRLFYTEKLTTLCTMVMLKISAFFIAYALIICQMYCSNAAPSRPALEPSPDEAMLSDYEARRLLNAFIKEFVQMAAEDLEQQETEENSITAQKRACNTATCVTHRLADFLNRSGGIGSNKFVPTNVGSHAFGRRRRLSQE